jgi:HK97 gp10 family phage protein
MPRASVSLDISSLKSLIKSMEEIDKKVRNKALKDALKEGRKIYLKAARGNVPTKYKILKKALGFRERFKFAKGFAYSIIGPKRRAGKTIDGKNRIPTKYAHFVEYGTAAHSIKKNSRTGKGVLGFAKRLILSFGGAYRHPGAAPNPFLRKSWDQNKSSVLSAMEKILKSAIEGGSV